MRTVTTTINLTVAEKVTPPIELLDHETVASAILEARSGESIGDAVVTPDWTSVDDTDEYDTWAAFTRTLTNAAPALDRLSIAGAHKLRFRTSTHDGSADPRAILHINLRGQR